MEGTVTIITVLGILGALLVFLLKYWFDKTNRGISENAKRMEEINEKINERIDHLEEKTYRDIAELRQDMNNIKSDFPTMFVQRDDFFRYMNGMEADIKDTNSKVDRILMLITDRRNGNGTQ